VAVEGSTVSDWFWLDADNEFLVCCTTLFFKRGKVRRAVTASDATTLETVDRPFCVCYNI